MTPGEKVTVEITTTSQVMQTEPSGPGNPPKITLNGNPFPPPKPLYASGLQVAVLDPSKDITNPASIRSNQYWALPNQNGSWMNVYVYMWRNAMKQVLVSGDTGEQLIFLATYGMDANVPPPADALAFLLGLGAGPQLQHWETSVDVGSQSGSWVGFPANYILVGGPGYRYGEGTEAYQTSGQNKSVTTSLQVTLTNAA
jgi:hypothetical protein